MRRWRDLFVAWLLALCAVAGAMASTVADHMPVQELRQAQLTSLRGTRSVTLPHVMERGDFGAEGTIVTYRMTIELPAAPTQALGITLDKLGLSGRIFVNGHDLGGCAPGDVRLSRCIYKPLWRYATPAVWRAGSNEVVVHVWATPSQANGLSVVTVGPARAVYEDHYRPRQFWQLDLVVALQWSIFTLGLMSLVIGIAMGGDRLYCWFGLAALARALSTSATLTTDVWFDPWWMNWLVSSLRVVTLPLTMIAMLAFFERLSRRMEIGLAIYAVVAVVIIALASAAQPAAMLVAAPIAALSAMLIVSFSVDILRSRKARDIILLMCVVVLFIAGMHDITVYRGLAYSRPLLMPYTSGVILLVLGGLLVVRLAEALRTSADLNTILADKVAAHEADLQRRHQAELDLERAGARVQERERFLRDLHDGLGSSLSAARIRLEDDTLGPQQVSQLLDECIDDMRLLIATSAPDAQLADSLGDLRYRMDRRMQNAGVKLQWQMALGEMPDIPAAARLQLMRIVQEALTNALRHAQATRIVVGAQYDAASCRLKLWVEDNGHGFDTLMPRAGGRGLRNQQYRAAQLGATLQTDSDAQGTRVELAWDLPGQVPRAASPARPASAGRPRALA